jgi:hypothetical protein
MADNPIVEGRNKGRAGRPSKKALQDTKQMSKREQSAALREFRQRLLLNPQSPRLLEKLFDTAFDDDHKQQGLAMKLLADRLMPVAGFTADGKQQAQVSINITGLSSGSTDTGVIIDGDSGDVEE